MKVVLFCGGQGMRIRDYSEEVPKPMVPLGDRPILWHVMKYYAHFGHTEFILCLGYQAATIKRFFLEYEEAVSNDFVLRKGGREMELLGSDIDDWDITFVDTGMYAPIGERLRRVQSHLSGDEMFLANYADGVSDLNLDCYIEAFATSNAVAGLVAIKPPQSYHVIKIENSKAEAIEPMAESDIWLNGGFFVLRREIFDYLEPGQELVEEPFRKLMADDRLFVHKLDGFFAPMDTFKDKKTLDQMYESGNAPWVVWKRDER